VADCQKLLADGDSSLDSARLVVMDEGFLDSWPALADSLLARAGGATAVFINLAISSCERLVREVRLALQRQQREKLLAARAAEDSLRGEISNHLTGILLNCELAIKNPLPAEAGAKLREIQRLTGELKARQHFLGDYPNVKWKHLCSALPQDLSGASVLDLGCNAGFYSIEMKKRNAARVVGVDLDDRYLRQASFAAATLQLDIEFLKMSVYEADTIPGEFDYVLFMGVFYHLRYPLYALDRIIKRVRGRLIFQTMLRGS